MTYITLNGKDLKKDWDKLKEAYLKDQCEPDEDEDESLLIDECMMGDVEFNKQDQTLLINFSTDYGFSSVEIPISDDLIFEMIEHLRKKGEKIKRLVNLTE